MKKNVAVIGCWHQGVVGAACLADMGYDVTGADTDAARVASLNTGKAPLFEPGLDELLRKGIEARRLRFTNDCAAAVEGCSHVLIMFDTPVDENDQSDLTCIFEAARAIAPKLEPGAAVLVTAQVPVGTGHALADILRETAPGRPFTLSYIPENLRLGQAIDRFRKPPLPVLGSDDAAAFAAWETLFAPMGVKWERVNLVTAEMTKHALNAFLAVSICFANELGNLCDEVGADGTRLAQVLRLEPRVGPKAMLMPGLGFSGGTLARDMQTLRGLGDRFGIETLLLDGAWTSNTIQNGLVLRKLRQALGELRGRRVAVLGLTYKPDTSTLRRSASLAIIGELAEAGVVVHAHDPKADRAELAEHNTFAFFEDPYEAARGCDALVLITAWKEYQALDFARLGEAMPGRFFIDVNNLYDAEKLHAAGWTYLDIGRGHRAV